MEVKSKGKFTPPTTVRTIHRDGCATLRFVVLGHLRSGDVAWRGVGQA